MSQLHPVACADEGFDSAVGVDAVDVHVWAAEQPVDVGQAVIRAKDGELGG